MTEQQIKLISEFCEKHAILPDTLVDVYSDNLERIMDEFNGSPLPHQDGASAEDVLKRYDIHASDVMGFVKTEYWVTHNDALLAMSEFAQSETAKVVAEKDREIERLEATLSESMEVKVNRVLAEAGKYEMDLEHPMFIAFIDTIIGVFKAAGAINYYAMKCVSNHEMYDFIIQRSEGKTPADIVGELRTELSTSNAHRTRLIESVKKWGGAWRTCRAELKEAKERVKELEEQINRFKNPLKAI